jgi:hypothetical protein
MAAVRSAAWVVAVDLALAVPLSFVAVGGGSTWTALLLSALRPVTFAGRSPGFLLRPVAGRAGALRTGARPALRALLLSATLLGLFGTLFLTADAAFAHLAGRLVPSIDVPLLSLRVLTFAGAAVLAGTLALNGRRFEGARAGRAPRLLQDLVGALFERGARDPDAEPRGFRRVEWVTALAALDLLFLAFVVVQLAVLFAGHDHVLRSAGLTYAEYARQGFFQLLVTGALALGVIAGSAGWARRSARSDEWVLRALLELLAVLTLVVLASALRRLHLYEEAYGFTRARLVAHTTILWLGAMLALVMAAGATGRTRWLPRTALAVTGMGVVAFNLVNPDGLVARHNVARHAATGRIDAGYLGTLSADAVPALAALPPSVSGPVLEPLGRSLARPDAWPSLNLGRSQARATLRDAGLLREPSED